mmetsp:Transcript_35059/g.86223  ORF Transcript_35059/g.86223 Transcript_35059/m.86223 type:complete len:227 (+) Transcript_35059:179-859(+)|eukprot:CAMPEP_0206236516 /NCGR_PEP_ID=MMETSP0047_2-20121206/13760_1 /ASSEMBLY_ACC=CAM_ASM_000192 /TAXON_ID=195065 /ORGANISM="Chroomonas mesostigmatica_cf, Strain CCMP1168" /LENGTH=226 /DNA_ID=CAMNT_0053660863 /DNA_START=105 /DNA_END=785 /DNA_ORIENTATION=+
MAAEGAAAEAPYARMDAGQEADPTRWCAGCECGVPANFSFKVHARQISTGVCLAMFVVPFIPGFSQWSTFLPDFLAQLLVATAIGCLELPFCFSFVAACRRLQVYLAPFERYLLRGILYILLGISLAFVNAFMAGRRDFINWVFVALVLVCGIMYVLSYLNGENAETGMEDQSTHLDRATSSISRSLSSAARTLSGGGDDSDDKDESELKKSLHKAALKAAMSTAV